jgi:hypothetical protein
MHILPHTRDEIFKRRLPATTVSYRLYENTFSITTRPSTLFRLPWADFGEVVLPGERYHTNPPM